MDHPLLFVVPRLFHWSSPDFSLSGEVVSGIPGTPHLAHGHVQKRRAPNHSRLCLRLAAASPSRNWRCGPV